MKARRVSEFGVIAFCTILARRSVGLSDASAPEPLMISQVTYNRIIQEPNSLPFANRLQSADGKRESHRP
jgi:hypothetical protein